MDCFWFPGVLRSHLLNVAPLAHTAGDLPISVHTSIEAFILSLCIYWVMCFSYVAVTSMEGFEHSR